MLCGSEKNLNVHHVFPRKFHKELQGDLDNLVVLDAKCHFRIHKDMGYIQLALWLMENRPGQWAYVLKNIKTPAAKSGISL